MRNKTKRVTLVGIMAILALSFFLPLPSNSLAMGKKVEQYPNPVGHFEKGPYLNEARHDHTATLLDDGNVLIAGGAATEKWEYPKSAELYVSKRNWFLRIKGLQIPRTNHAAVKLKNGKVLFFGGNGPGVLKGKELDTVEEYDPQTQKFSIVGKMLDTRWFCQAVLLDNGKIFIYGGVPWGSEGIWHCELYDPITNTSSYTSKMHYQGAQQGKVLTKLEDGRVFIKVGTPYSPEEEAEYLKKFKYPPISRLGAIEIYDPKTDQFDLQYVLQEYRREGSQLLLPDNRILLIGGYKHAGCFGIFGKERSTNIEIYDPAIKTSKYFGNINYFIRKIDLVLIKKRYFFCIGWEGRKETDPLEVFDIQENKVIKVGPMNILKGNSTITAMLDGNLLFIGGYQDKIGQKRTMSDIFIVKKE